MNDDQDKTLNTMGGDEPPRKDKNEAGSLLLKRYRIEGLLGEGGMGRVYRCFDTVSGLYVAVKRVPDTLASNPVEMKSIRDNFALIARLNHPGIANIKNLERDEATGEYFIIMELVEGADLKDFAETMKLGEIIPVVRHIAEALDYAHRERIIHRDIKPRNIRVDPRGNVKILDFGIASQFHESMTRIGVRHMETSGTGPYMSPEQWRGEDQDARSDQYSLAIMAYEMIVGRPPFLASDMSVLRTMVLENQIQRPKEIGPEAWKAFAKALSKKREDRYTSCGSFVADLDRGHKLDGQPKGAARAAAASPARKKPGKALRLAAAAGLAVIVFGGLMLWMTDAEKEAPVPAPRGERPAPPPRAETPAEPPRVEIAAPPPRVEKPVEPVAEIAPPAPATLQIMSRPENVEVYLGDVLLGRTPITVTNSAPAQFTLKRDGYRSQVVAHDFAGPSDPRLVALEQQAGAVSIRTRPTRAEVTLADRTLTSPALFEDIPAGEYEVVITHPDREEMMEVVVVEDGVVTRHTFDLPEAAPVAELPAIGPVVEPASSVDASSDLPPGSRPRLILVPARYDGDVEARVLRDLGEQFGSDSPRGLEGATLTGYLLSAFHNADRFDVLERVFLDEAVKELQLSQTDLADPARAVKVGGLLNAQYILIPTIRQVGLHKDERHIDAAQETMVRLQGDITIGLRLVDVKTTRILNDREITERVQRTGTLGRMDLQRETDTLVRDLFQAGARRAALAVIGDYYPVRIVQVTDNLALIDQGRGVVEKGDRFDILQDTDDPSGEARGEIEIVTVREKVAEAHLLKGGPVREGMICRWKEPARNPLLLR